MVRRGVALHGLAHDVRVDAGTLLPGVVERLKDFLEAGNYSAADFTIGFPAVLGLEHASLVWYDLQNQLGYPVFELPGLPPSIPGIRLHRILTQAIEQQGGRVFDGMQVLEAQVEDSSIQAVFSEAAARHKPHRAANYILATGGFLGGGLAAKSSGSIDETIFHLPVDSPPGRETWYQRQFLAPGGHSIFTSGISVNKRLQPRTMDDLPIYRNLFAVGAALTGADSLRERSVEGIALATAYGAANNLSEEPESGEQHHA